MRIRRKKWARPELAVCPYYTEATASMKGEWRTLFTDSTRPLYLELGCGKGIFAAQHALKYPEINLIAADIKADMLGVARRTVESMFAAAGKTQDNLHLVRMNISYISDFFSEKDEIDRIYINFCNPWSRPKHNKRRLTHPRVLEQYKAILKEGAQIHFKTDDDGLFEDSINYFNESGYELIYITRDLHESDYKDNLITEHERLFSSEGIKIKFLIAVNNLKEIK